MGACWAGSILTDLTGRRRTGREDVLNGIAYDVLGDRLFVTGKLWPKLFEIKVVPVHGKKRRNRYFNFAYQETFAPDCSVPFHSRLVLAHSFWLLHRNAPG